MRIHSDVFTRDSFDAALWPRSLNVQGVNIEDLSEHRSRSRARAFEVRLAATPGRDYSGKARRPRNSGAYGAESLYAGQTIKAATYNEHGQWIAELYAADPDAIIGPYRHYDHFHASTRFAYSGARQ